MSAISLFATSQFELPKAQRVFTPIKEWENCQTLDLASQTEERAKEQFKSFPKGLSL